MKQLRAIPQKEQAQLLEHAVNFCLFLQDSSNWENFQDGWEEMQGTSKAATTARAKAIKFLRAVEQAERSIEDMPETRTVSHTTGFSCGWSA